MARIDLADPDDLPAEKRSLPGLNRREVSIREGDDVLLVPFE